MTFKLCQTTQTLVKLIYFIQPIINHSVVLVMMSSFNFKGVSGST